MAFVKLFVTGMTCSITFYNPQKLGTNHVRMIHVSLMAHQYQAKLLFALQYT